MSKKSNFKYLRRTPWDYSVEKTLVQQALTEAYLSNYYNKHQSLLFAGEATYLNKISVNSCPYCDSVNFKKNGFSKNGVQQYKCKDCDRKFSVTTNTIFEDHKIPIKEWLELCLNIFKFSSTSATARNNKNSPTTSEYWLSKLFLLLEDYQNDLVLEDIVYFDETYYSEVKRKITVTEDGKKKRGLSKNKYCIAVGVDATGVCCFVCGKGKPSKNRIFNSFKDKIKKGSLMINDGENAHFKIVKKLELKQEIHLSSETKGLSSKDNPMDRINHIHFLLKEFLDSHSGFNRDELQNYLNLFCFIMNPPVDPLEKVEIIKNFAFQKR